MRRTIALRRGQVRAAALLLVAALAVLGACANRARPVILVTVDALRADHVGVYGRAPLPTPHFDALGREGAIIEQAVAPFGRTTQGMTAILSGLHPVAAGADGLGMALPDRVTTLAQRFAAAGYETGAFTSNVFLRPGLGFERGFRVYSNPQQRWDGDSAQAITLEALAWAENAASSGKPVFLWVHYLDPHWTYEPGADWARRADPEWNGAFELFARVGSTALTKGQAIFEADRHLSPREIEHVRRLYAAEVAQSDAAVGELVRGLRAIPGLEDAIVVLTADHGESLGEHRYWFAHGEYTYAPSLRVPLLVQAPGLVPSGTRVTGTVPTEDVAPTLLDLAGLGVPDGLDGRSLAPLLTGGGRATAPARAVVHVADHVLVHPENPRRPVPGREGRWWAIEEGGLKLVRIPAGNGRFTEELYDLAADPGETRDLAPARPQDAARLRDALLERQRALLARWQNSGAEDPVPVEQQMLRSLGYVR